jgi:hypothetical protein
LNNEAKEEKMITQIAHLYNRALENKIDKFFEMKKQNDDTSYCGKQYKFFWSDKGQIYVNEFDVCITFPPFSSSHNGHFHLKRNGEVTTNYISSINTADLSYVDLAMLYRFLKEAIMMLI